MKYANILHLFSFQTPKLLKYKYQIKYRYMYDDYETERKYLYKYLMNMYIDKLLVDSRCYNT